MHITKRDKEITIEASMILDDRKRMATLDPGGILASIEALPNQIVEAWAEARAVRLPKSYADVCAVAVAGMGGSALGAHIVRSVYGHKLGLPFSITNHYELPAVDPYTLVVLSSYSGNTEEVLAAGKQALAVKAKVAVATSGGALADWSRRHKIPGYFFTPVHNPSGQPRTGLGYGIFGFLGLLQAAGLIRVSQTEIAAAVAAARRAIKRYGASVSAARNPAKRLARALAPSCALVISAEHLSGNGHALQNQIHETGKHFAAWFDLPELDHHLLEGLTHPSGKKLHAVFLSSRKYHPRIHARIPITADVLKRQGVAATSFVPGETTLLGEAVETLVFGSFVSFYLAMLHGENPSFIPWVDYLKRRIGG